MMTQQELEQYILSFDAVWLDYPFGEDTAVYKYGQAPEGKIVALVEQGSRPLRVSLKCDPQLAKVLRERYESVLPATMVNKKYWNTIICSGQLSQDEVFDLVRLSYQIVKDDQTKE